MEEMSRLLVLPFQTGHKTGILGISLNMDNSENHQRILCNIREKFLRSKYFIIQLFV